MPMTTPQKRRSLLILECILLACHFQDCSVVESTKDAPKDRTTLVVFIGLLIDLLGIKRKMKNSLIE